MAASLVSFFCLQISPCCLVQEKIFILNFKLKNEATRDDLKEDKRIFIYLFIYLLSLGLLLHIKKIKKTTKKTKKKTNMARGAATV